MSGTTTNRPPIGTVFLPDGIPAEIKQLRRWCVWRAVWNEKRQKWDKIPYHPKTHNGLSTRLVENWTSFEDALSALRQNPDRYAGLGLVLTGARDLLGVDLDDCVGPSGVPEPWAVDVLERLDSYTELSPSGRGLRILAHGSAASDFVNHDRGVELYNGHTPRFLTITGDALRNRPLRTLGDEVTWLETLYRRKAEVKDLAISAELPELIDSALLPDLHALGVPDAERVFLLTGESEHGDNSLALHTAGIRLLEMGLTEQEVLSVLASYPGSAEVALAHRSQDWDRALSYLWVEHIQKALPKARTPQSVMDDFDDVSGALEVAPSPKSLAPGGPSGAKPTFRSRFALQSYEDFTRPRKTLWIVKKLLPQAELGVIYGASGSGKSFLTLDLCAAAARGEDWRGLKSRQVNVVYVTAEGQEDFRRRVTAYALDHAIHAQPNGGMNLWFIDEAPNLLDVADSRELIKQIAACPGGKPELVVIDTLAQVMPGGNENSGEDVGKVLGHCRAISRATGAMVLLVHHSGKDEARGARGWSGLRAAADFEIEVSRDDKDRLATLTKLKGGEDGLQFPFRLEVMPLDIDEDGDEITSCVVRHQDHLPQRKVDSRTLAQEVLVRELQNFYDLDSSWPVQNVLIKRAAEMLPEPMEGERDKRTSEVTRALHLLLSRGELLRVGSNSHIQIPTKGA